MVCSELAVTLQCLGKLYLGTVFSGKQRNIYKHIYRIYSPTHCKPPSYKDIHQRSYLKLWKTLLVCNNTYVKLHSGAASNTVRKYFKIDKDIIILQDSTKTFWP